MSQAPRFILYVADQNRSAAFYETVLAVRPHLQVPGMTEFLLPGGAILGLMPEAGIRRLLGAAIPDPSSGNGIPRSELYLVLDEPSAFHLRALAAGATELSPMLVRDWGDSVAYSLDSDGHVLAFALRGSKEP